MKLDRASLQELLARTAAGDQQAFAEIYQRTNAHLFGLALRMLRHEATAEDVLQEAFISIWKSASLYRSRVEGQDIQPMTWLIAIVRNKALDALRSRARRGESAMPEPEALNESNMHVSVSSALELFTQAAQALKVEACMQTLGGNHRQSLALAYYHGLSHSEIAAHTGAPLGSIKAWIRRGLDKLKSCLEAQGAAP